MQSSENSIMGYTHWKHAIYWLFFFFKHELTLEKEAESIYLTETLHSKKGPSQWS